MSSGLATSEMEGPSCIDVNQDVVMLAPMDNEMNLTMNSAFPQFFTEYSNRKDNQGPK